MYYTNVGAKKVAEVVALLMFIGPDIKEHRIQPEGMAQCLRHKRIAETVQPNIQYKCIDLKQTRNKY